MPAASLARLIRSHPVAAFVTAALLVAPAAAAETVTAGGLTLVNKGLVGVGRIPADQRDKFGETFGSGSGMAADPKAWTRTADGYSGTFYLLPDRGYNVSGTTDYRARLYKLSIAFKPVADAAAMPEAERQRSVVATIADTIPLTDAAGQSLTGLDPVEGGVRPAAGGFPDLPQAATGHVAIDAEAIVLMPDGSFFISDEYGPYIYRFSADGRLDLGDQAARRLHSDAQRQAALLVQQSRTGSGSAEAQRPGNRAAEQPGL